MFGASEFRNLVSGQRRGPAATLLRAFLQLAEAPYIWEVQRRNRAYDTGRRQIHTVPVPVVSVGNLTLGGTGKTPLVVWLAQYFQNHGIRVVLVSRGYKSTSGQLNDEGLELKQKLPDVPHLQNPDRVAAAHMAIDEHHAQLILLDDGFQHRRLARNLDIVLLDALEPFGFDHVFPRGTLREPAANLKRAHLAVLTRADMISDDDRSQIHKRVQQIAPQIAWAACCHAPKSLLGVDGNTQPIAALAGRRIAAFCGIGNPSGFRHTLSRCDANIVSWREFPDHHHYSPADIDDLSQWIASTSCELAICTHKDFVKIARPTLADKPLLAATVAVEFIEGRENLENLLLPLAAQVVPPQLGQSAAKHS